MNLARNLAVGEGLLVAPISSAGGTGTRFCRGTGNVASEAQRSDKPCVLRVQGRTRLREGGMQHHREGRLMQEEARHRREGHEHRRGWEGEPLAEKAKEVVGAWEGSRRS
jgi:hypothetical protein